MKPHHRKQLDSAVLAQAAAAWGGSVDRIIDSSVNLVCTIQTPAGVRILRIMHEQHRSRAALQAELAWIADLAGRGMTACRAIESQHGCLIEALPAASGDFLITAFQHAPGRRPTRADLHRNHMMQLGSLIAQMHNLTVGRPGTHRPPWDHKLDNLIKVLSSRDESAGRALDLLTQQMRHLPRDADAFGLIHADVHVGNYHLHDDEIWLYDFDNCVESWHAADLATLWFFSLMRTSGTDLEIWQSASGPMLKAILDGYRQVRPLNEYWVAQLPLFRRHRALCLYAHKLLGRAGKSPASSEQQLSLLRCCAMQREDGALL